MTGSRHSRISRRDFSKAVTGGSMLIGFNTASGSWVFAEERMDGAAFTRLPQLDGELFIDDVTRTAYASDNGQIVHERPIAVLRPGSMEDIARIVRFAGRHGLQIAARGEGHQPYGQAQVRHGIVIDMRSLQMVHALHGDRIDVDAGITWRELLHASLGYGLTPPVLTAFLGLTVGGTLSIGGVGLASFRHGAQADQASVLQIIAGTGDVIECSSEKHPELFAMALAGQGQCGVIARATLTLEPAPTMIREYVLPYANLQQLLHDGWKLTQEGRFDGTLALLVPKDTGWSYVLTAIRYFTPSNAPDDDALTSGLNFIRGTEKLRDVSYLEYMDVTPPFDPAQAHANLGLCVPQSVAELFIAGMQSRLTPTDLGPVEAIRLFFFQRASFTRPLMRVPQEDRFCYAAILRSETSDAGAISRMLSGNRTLFEYSRDSGGTLYPYAALEMDQSDWRRHYGSRWPELVRAKRRYDPHHIFASGPNLDLSRAEA